ncbi:hypothetical protein B0H15DRAFT_806144 [Mycena belliarum]|uniref:Uncharacterized protein n=1 Tax=Mycena belliarum TaxID=1033014 RepID=A0AAD6XHL9_9AGAR|nr:hypothetical protein B0H15DRAFT_806144 [Mycena belliae]
MLNQFSSKAMLNQASTYVSRVDARAQWLHTPWTAPFQATKCLITLLVELGPSALAGFAHFRLVIPLQESERMIEPHTAEGCEGWVGFPAFHTAALRAFITVEAGG